MGLRTIFVSGPRRSGKSLVVRSIVDHVLTSRPHFLRLVEVGGDKLAPLLPAEPPKDSGVASARCIEYEADRIFELLPEAISSIQKRDPFGAVIIEADADPILRCAYPYDHRVFVMPAPSTLSEVFRDSHDAAGELRKVLDDTAAFASEIFGLFEEPIDGEHDPSEDRCDLSGTQIRSFLYSPLGDELATRIQLQQPYHGLVESDVILVNTAMVQQASWSTECLHRIERLLDRLRAGSVNRAQMFRCSTSDLDITYQQFLLALKTLCEPFK